MSARTECRVIDVPGLRNRIHVFCDRSHAGTVLAEMLGEYRGTDAIVLAIPAGGVPVAAVVARTLGLPLDVAVVSKITLPWNTEAGYGAVAFDGTVHLNAELVGHVGLPEAEVERGIARTRTRVAERVKALRGERPPLALEARTVILIDDGLASGFTMRAAVEAVRQCGASRVLIAVPTAHHESIERVKGAVEAIYCPNVRRGWSFAVAEAYERWYDVSLDEARQILGSEL